MPRCWPTSWARPATSAHRPPGSAKPSSSASTKKRTASSSVNSRLRMCVVELPHHHPEVPRMKAPFLALACVLGLASLARAEAPFEVVKAADLAYRDDADADPVRHRLDVYSPK